jgi:hypothetical protein
MKLNNISGAMHALMKFPHAGLHFVVPIIYDKVGWRIQTITGDGIPRFIYCSYANQLSQRIKDENL